MSIAYLGLGSNMGDRKQFLHDALKLLMNHPQIKVSVVSSLYETKPWGYVEQDVFMNLVVEIETELSPLALLAYCLEIEQELGRVRKIKWGPRVIDVDVLLYDKLTLETEKLTIPHPFMTQRDFVMIPLAEIAPQLLIGDKSVKKIASAFDETQLIKLSKR